MCEVAWAEIQISPAGFIPENKGNGSQYKCLYKRAWSGGARGSRAGRQGRISCQPGIGDLQDLYRSYLSRWTWRSTRPGRRTLPAGMQNPDSAAGGQSYAALLLRLRQQQEQRSRHIVGTWQPVLDPQASANRLRRRPAAVGALYICVI